ncbi:MAG: AAA family ATPase, partial [Gemmatimonadota bacterium]
MKLNARLTIAIAVSLSIILAVTGSWFWRRHRAATAPPVTLTYSTFTTALDAGQVDSIALTPGKEILGWSSASRIPGGRFRVVYSAPDVQSVLTRAERAHVPMTFSAPVTPGMTMDYINLAISLAVLGGLVFFVVRQARGPSGGAEVGNAERSGNTFAQVAGNEGAVSELKEIVEFLRAPTKFARLGARTPKGVLMFGPPGTGKTLMARSVAGEAGVPFWSISGSEVTGFLIGTGVARIRALFRKARKRGGVIFIDEIDALGGRRGRNQSHNEDDRTLNQLLVEMDGFAPSDGVVVIGATNRPDDLDPALLRAGRFDRMVSVGLPTAREREAILRLHVTDRRVPMEADVDLHRLARLMPQSSGADLARLINESAIAAGRREAARVAWKDVEMARDRLLLGKERS